jgi:DNA-directed RNA polymerase specialized sigma24 family protein
VPTSKSHPSSPTVELWATVPSQYPRARHTSTAVPANPLQALMEARPNDTPETSQSEIDVLREHVAAVVEMLPDMQRYVIEGLFIEGISLRDMAYRLSRSKTTVTRLRDTALATMKELLESNETIQERLSE